MTRRLLLSKWTPRLLWYPGWLAVLLLVISALAPLSLFPDPVQAQSGITAPTSGAYSGDVPIIGTAVIDPFQRYELYYKLEPSGDDAYIYFDGGTTQITNGQLGTWRTANLAPGAYSIRLRVVKTDGNYGEFFVRDLVVNQSAAAEPTPTPTSSEPTPTPIPTATFTPAPQPTPIVGQVTQPEVESDDPILAPTPIADSTLLTGTADSSTGTGGENANTLFTGAAASTPQEVTTSFTRELGEAVAVDRLRGFFFTGMRVSAILILGSIVLLAGRRLVSWVWTQYR
ncbi:MAG: hypothetical protein DYG89_49285 [Caldilinea sp. CFX5]|nr:hypothetical protein [Caldilinea sp. CFX5]